MKIISKFKDYYDCGVSYGIDEKLHFIRHTEEFKVCKSFSELIGNPDFRDIIRHKYREFNYNKKTITDYKLLILLFCGKFIPIIEFSHKVKSTTKFGLDTINKDFIHGYDKCLEFYKINDIEHMFIEFHKSLISDIINNEHINEQSPILLYEYNGYNYWNGFTLNGVKNIKLKDYKLVKYLDPITTFQEISMFMGNTLCDTSTPKMPVGGDKVILKSKGFDEKYGFRTRPHKKK